MRKFVPQLRMRCSMPKRTVSYPETWLNWGTEESDQVWWPSWTWRLYGDGITKVLWAWELEKLKSSGNNFVFDTFRNFEPVKRFENMISRWRPGSCNNGTGERILDMLESIYLGFRKIKVQWVTVIRVSGVTNRPAKLSHIQCKLWAGSRQPAVRALTKS